MFILVYLCFLLIINIIIKMKKKKKITPMTEKDTHNFLVMTLNVNHCIEIL